MGGGGEIDKGKVKEGKESRRCCCCCCVLLLPLITAIDVMYSRRRIRAPYLPMFVAFLGLSLFCFVCFDPFLLFRFLSILPLLGLFLVLFTSCPWAQSSFGLVRNYKRARDISLVRSFESAAVREKREKMISRIIRQEKQKRTGFIVTREIDNGNLNWTITDTLTGARACFHSMSYVTTVCPLHVATYKSDVA